MRKVFVLASALLIGFLLASAFTHVTYSCTHPASAGCTTFDKAVMRPNDLLHNKQGSLVRFTENFFVGTAIGLVAINIYTFTRKKI